MRGRVGCKPDCRASGDRACPLYTSVPHPRKILPPGHCLRSPINSTLLITFTKDLRFLGWHQRGLILPSAGRLSLRKTRVQRGCLDHEGWRDLQGPEPPSGLGRARYHHGHPKDGRVAQLLAHVSRAWQLDSRVLLRDSVLLSLRSVFLFTRVFCQAVRTLFLAKAGICMCVLLHRTFLARAQNSLKFCILVSFMGTEKGWDAQLFLRVFCWWWWWRAPKRKVEEAARGAPCAWRVSGPPQLLASGLTSLD